MARHVGALLTFEYPRDWIERTEVRYEAPRRQGQVAGSSPGRAVLATDALRDGESLLSFVEKHLLRHSTGAGFTLHELRETHVEERPAVAVAFALVSDGLPLEHRALFVRVGSEQIAIFTLSCPRSEFAQNEPLFERMLASVKLGE